MSPGLTHRGFILSRGQRRANGIASARRVEQEILPLQGANDLLAMGDQIECLLTVKQCETAKARLAKRLGRRVSAIGGYDSRGVGGATPLALPEMLKFLISRLNEI
ncbi:MAG TPA: hypothetical protein VGT24_09755 [Candidatus Acidoferrales bacterium]|nr:hypothetical protein [Candidatus Acidoferrales bacterium]